MILNFGFKVSQNQGITIMIWLHRNSQQEIYVQRTFESDQSLSSLSLVYMIDIVLNGAKMSIKLHLSSVYLLSTNTRTITQISQRISTNVSHWKSRERYGVCLRKGLLKPTRHRCN